MLEPGEDRLDHLAGCWESVGRLGQGADEPDQSGAGKAIGPEKKPGLDS